MNQYQLPLLLCVMILSGIGVLTALLTMKMPKLIKIMGMLAFTNALLVTAMLVVRGVVGGILPLSNGIDFSLWLQLMLLLFILFFIRKTNIALANALIFLIVGGLSIWMFSLNLEVVPLAPALRSPWLAIHVMMAIMSYGCLCVSFVFALLILIQQKSKTDDVYLKLLDDWSYRLVVIGLPLLTVMLITGSVWAEYSWGSYWSWDWKETWALITWLVYALYLHLRVSGWKHRKAAILNIIGFAVVVFTFFGVSYLLPGLHSYL